MCATSDLQLSDPDRIFHSNSWTQSFSHPLPNAYVNLTHKSVHVITIPTNEISSCTLFKSSILGSWQCCRKSVFELGRVKKFPILPSSIEGTLWLHNSTRILQPTTHNNMMDLLCRQMSCWRMWGPFQCPGEAISMQWVSCNVDTYVATSLNVLNVHWLDQFHKQQEVLTRPSWHHLQFEGILREIWSLQGVLLLS